MKWPRRSWQIVPHRGAGAESARRANAGHVLQRSVNFFRAPVHVLSRQAKETNLSNDGAGSARQDFCFGPEFQQPNAHMTEPDEVERIGAVALLEKNLPGAHADE